jgi:glutathione S-transferase
MAEQVDKIVYWEDILSRGEFVAQTYLLCGVPFEFVWVEVSEYPKPKIYEKVGNFPNMPMLILPNGEVISETFAIIQNVALSHKPELLGKTIEDKVQVTMLIGVINDAIITVMKSIYAPDWETRIPEGLKGTWAKKLGYIAKHLAGRTTLVGDYYTAADAYLNYALEYGMDVDRALDVKAFDYSVFEKYLSAFRSIPAIKAHYESEKRAKLHFLPSCGLKIPVKN